MTLTLNRFGRNMGSAHRQHEVNVCHKFHENASSPFGNMEQTRFLDTETDGQTDIQDIHKQYISPVYMGGGGIIIVY